MFSRSHQLTVEWGDCDPAGIIFYPRFFAMFDAATAFLLEAASGMPRAELIRHHGILGWPMVDTRATFRGPVSFDDKVRIDSAVTRIGRSSFSISHGLWRGELLCVEGEETRVWSRRSADGGLIAEPIPDALRARLKGN